jgi:hypothetical protein
MKIRYSKFKSDQGFGKYFWKTLTGEVAKKTIVAMSEGYFETITCDWSEFGARLAECQPMEANAYGVCVKKSKAGSYIQEGQIVKQEMEAKLILEDRDTGVVSKTRKNFQFHNGTCDFHNVLYIDIDDLTGIEGSSDEEILEGTCEKLLELFPELAKLESGLWVRPSAGANIFDTETGELIKGISGVHVYFAIPPHIQMKDVIHYLKQTQWLNGSAYYKQTEGKLAAGNRPAGLIDETVLKPEHLDFAGGSSCRPPLEQRMIDPIWIPQQVDDQPSFILTPEQELQAQEIRNNLQREAAAITSRRNREIRGELKKEGHQLVNRPANLSRLEEGYLPPNLEIVFNNGDKVPIWKLIFFPEKYHEQYCEDPQVPEKGTQKAGFFYNADQDRENRFIIASFLGGGRNYKLETDMEGIKQMLESTGDSEIRDGFATKEWWIQEVSRLETEGARNEILEILKKKGVGDKTTIRSRMNEEIKASSFWDNQKILDKMNKVFAYVTIQGKACFIEERCDDIELRAYSDFLLEAAGWPKIKMISSTGAPRMENPGKVWTNWEGRRSYDGVKFAPYTTEREFKEGDKLFLNRYRGLKTQPTPPEARACRMEHCQGKGCIAYFESRIEAGKKAICPAEGTWTYWLQTIHDVAAKGEITHTQWLLDWFADMIQAPGGRGSRHARSEVSVCLRGGQGTGKGAIIEPIMHILEPYAIKVAEMERITAKFNSIMEDKLLVFADEAIWGGSYKEGNKLKDIITGKDILIERKGINTYATTNFIRVFIASNSEWVVPAEEDERRYTVFDVAETYKKDRDWFALVNAGNLGDLMADLLGRAITQDVNKNLDTDALEAQKSFRRDLVDDFLAEAAGESWFWDEDGNGLIVSHEELERVFSERYSNRRIFAETPEGFKRRLRKRLNDKGGQLKVKVRVNNKYVNGFIMPHREFMTHKFPWMRPLFADPEDDA